MKVIYYAITQKLEVPDNATDKEIEDLIIDNMLKQVGEPTDYVWSDTSNLFWEDKY